MERSECVAFAERIKFLRCRYFLTQEELGDMLGVTRASIGYYESLKRTPTITILFKAAQLFGVSTDFLLGLTNEYISGGFGGKVAIHGKK